MTAHRPAPFQRFRVLVVDDDVAIVKSLTRVLEDDVDVIGCTSTTRALELLAFDEFHVVCSDFDMPGMNGLELLRRVVNLPTYTSCLLLTGSDRYKGGGDGGRHYVLLKPFDPERLISLIVQLGRVAQMKRSVHLLSSSVRPRPTGT